MKRLSLLSVLLLTFFLSACQTPPPKEMICPINIQALGTNDTRDCVLNTGQNIDGAKYEKRAALQLAPNQVGLFAGQQQDQDVIVMRNIGYNNAPADFSFVYPEDVRQIRTDSDVNSCSEQQRANNECTPPLDGILFSGGIRGTVNITIDMRLVINEENASRWMRVGGYSKFISLLWGEIRSYRSASSHIEPDNSDPGKTAEAIRQLYITRLMGSEVQGSPRWAYADMIELQSLTVRGLTIGDAAYQASLAELRAQELRAREEAKLLKLLLENETARQELESARAKFEREQASLDAVAFVEQMQTICAGMTDQSMCVQMVWVWIGGRSNAPVLTQNGLTAPVTVPNSGPAPTVTPGQ